MDTAGQTADQAVNISLKYTEKLAQLTGAGLLQFATFLIRYLEKNNQLSGLTNLDKILESKQKLKFYEIDKTKLADFKTAAKKYGVLYTIIEPNTNGKAEIITGENYIEQFKKVLEKIGYDKPYELDLPNEQTLLALSKNELSERGDMQMPPISQEKERVKVWVEKIKRQMGNPFDENKTKKLEEEKT